MQDAPGPRLKVERCLQRSGCVRRSAIDHKDSLRTIQALILTLVAAGALAASGGAAPAADLSGHVPEAVANLQAVGRLEGWQAIEAGLGLAPRDETGLDKFLQELYDPTSPNYRHYLTPDQFTGRFGPTEPDYQGAD